ncbi:MAG: hypothetical protein ACI9G1_002038 [Pirellulaceae bacterium]|jgi:hypothetical protein
MKMKFGITLVFCIVVGFTLLVGSEPAKSQSADKANLLFRELDYLEGHKGQGNWIFSDVEGAASKPAKIICSWNKWHQATSRWEKHWEKMGREYTGYEWMSTYMSTVPKQLWKERVFDDSVVVFVSHQAFGDHKVKIHDPVIKGRTVVVNITDVVDPKPDGQVDYGFEFTRWIGIKRTGIDDIEIQINGKSSQTLNVGKDEK